MNNIVIIGSGALAAELTSHIYNINSCNIDSLVIKGYLDDDFNNFKYNSEKYKYNSPYLGTLKDYKFSQNEEYALGIGSTESRKKIIDKLTIHGLKFKNLIHPLAQIDKNSILGLGNIVYSNTIIGPNVNIGNHNIFTSFSFISHDCYIGNNNFFSTSGLAGAVIIGNDNFFGIRSTIIPFIKIGNSNIIKAGMIVDKDIGNQETVFYRFKEKVSIIKSTNENEK
jgi:sugar O-acyltransferase (sialic acid O-acetyltransferase NeuD family)